MSRKLKNFLAKCEQTVKFHAQGLKGGLIEAPKGAKIDPQTANLAYVRWQHLDGPRREKLEALEPERAIALLTAWRT